MGYFWLRGRVKKTVLGSTHVVLFLLFGALIGYFEGWVQVQFVLGSSHIVQQFLFSLFPSILIFDLDLILGLFFTFWGPNGIFLRLG